MTTMLTTLALALVGGAQVVYGVARKETRWFRDALGVKTMGTW